MKKILLLSLVAFGLSQITNSQEVITTVDCNQTGLVVNVGSYPNMVSLYHSGNYLTWPQSSNVIVWKITDTQDNLIAQDTIVGESFFSFGHDLSLTDTINVSAHLTNHDAIHEGFPVNCLIEDQLYWKITEVLPPQELFPDGMYTESWSFVHENVGVDQNSLIDSCIAYPIEDCMSIDLWDPVCGCDGVTYSNSGDAVCNSIYDFTSGECTNISDNPCSGISILLSQGWNMIGFACSENANALNVFAAIQDKIVIAKDGVGNAYLPDWDFNGIGDLERGYGYLIKVSEEISNYNICE